MNRISFVLVSAIFFWMPVLFCLNFVFPYSGSSIFVISLVLTGAMTFFGSILYLLGISHKNRKFYLAVPFCIDALVIVIAGSMAIFYGESFLSDPVNIIDTAAIVALALLAPCSAALFYSLPEHGRVTRISIALSLLISVLAILSIVFTLRDLTIRPTIHAVLGLLGLYWMIGMPLIGICFIANAVNKRDTVPSS